ncbi:MAG: hypothetical protein SOU82_02580 [Alloprevotella sp.]|nr:hypothetical protein [Prevotellamassilia sp.]MDY2623566.1 hypothetical protein [Alloprevotella sp.]MDY2778723.1 hypothetical protein [Alloprevotella sp.]MDY5761621.1 hypothetical protein [Alloprevotella sp.]
MSKKTETARQDHSNKATATTAPVLTQPQQALADTANICTKPA